MKNNYDHPLVAACYDQDNPDGPDHEFYRNLADTLQAQTIADLGCGTGILTVTLTKPNRTVIGIDPAPAMLDYAAKRPGGDAVTWIAGTSEKIAPNSYDLIIMTGNAAMHIIGDSWRTTLLDIAQGLKPDGVLAFESRNPKAEAWHTWAHPMTMRESPVGRIKESITVDEPDEQGVISMFMTTEFLEHGLTLETKQKLQFRSYQQISDDLRSVGLEIRGCYRDWDQNPFTDSAEELVIVVVAARKSPHFKKLHHLLHETITTGTSTFSTTHPNPPSINAARYVDEYLN